MLKSSIRSVVLCLLLCAAAAVAEAGKKDAEEVQFHPAIEAYFALPGDLEPTDEQKEQLARLRLAYGPRLQALAPAVAQAYNIREVVQQAKPALRGARTARRAGVPVPRLGALGARRKLGAVAPQVRAVLRQFEALEKEIDRQVGELLTPEQKKALAAQRRREGEERKKGGKDEN